MKLFPKLMLAVLVIGMLLPFTLLKDDQGKTLMSFSDIGLPDFELPGLPDMPAAQDLVPVNPVSGGTDRFYKWYDAHGNVQFTSEPPPEGVQFTVKEFDPNANVIQAVKVPERDEDAESAVGSVQEGPADEDADQDTASAFDPETIEKMFEKTRNIEKLFEQRSQDLNTAINQ